MQIADCRLQIVDENLPAMLAYFSIEQQCRYHNRAFRQWFGLKSGQIDGQFLKNIFNSSFCAAIQQAIERVLAGETVQNQHVQQLSNQFACLVTGYLIPNFDFGGEVIGFYTLYAPRLLKKGEKLPEIGRDKSAAEIDKGGKKNVQNQCGQTAHHPVEAFIDSSRSVIDAIKKGEFCLFCQKIVPVGLHQDAELRYEILIRMTEEESNFIPPGAFLPFVEKHNLMPRLDHWVVSKTIQHLAKHMGNSEVSLCINVAGGTLEDRSFTDYIQQQLTELGVHPQKLCFEIETSDAVANLSETVLFARKIRQLGCRISLCSFNHNQISFDLLKHIRADFLKIDGSLIGNILRDTGDLKKVEDINRFAQALKIKTIGELVEAPDVLDKLAKIGVNYAQGFGIERPHPLDEIINNQL